MVDYVETARKTSDRGGVQVTVRVLDGDRKLVVRVAPHQSHEDGVAEAVAMAVATMPAKVRRR